MTWHAKDYSGPDSVAGLIDSLQGRTALVCGNADGVFEEYESLYTGKEVVFAANDVGMYLRRVDHLVSYHVRKLPHWSAIRHVDSAIEKTWKTHGGGSKIGDVDYLWYGLEPTTFPLSGQLAMLLAYLMGCERIILCGCPMDGTKRFFDAKPRIDFAYGSGLTPSDKAARETVLREMKRVPDFKARVRSCSGWTRDYFGGVDEGMVSRSTLLRQAG